MRGAALPQAVEIIDGLHFRSSRAPGARRNVKSSRIPGALSGLRPREREKGVSLRERGRRKETERERERERECCLLVLDSVTSKPQWIRYKELDRECVKERRDMRQIDPYHLI